MVLYTFVVFVFNLLCSEPSVLIHYLQGVKNSNVVSIAMTYSY